MLRRSSDSVPLINDYLGCGMTQSLSILTLIARLFSQGENASTAPPEEVTLKHLTPRELNAVEVSTVSRHEEFLLNAPSAVYVIGQEDIRRSGLDSIPELLRLSPGVNVARINANKWGVSARGFNSRFANKLLVLMDGRTLYTPVFSGVYWDVQDYLLEDIAQIEVVRGPGGTLWGANAVNGVINIQSKSAMDTQGVLLNSELGTHRQGGGVRYGGKLADDVYYRVYGRGFWHDDFRLPDGSEGSGEWWSQFEGFRLDWQPTENDLVTFQGDGYYTEAGDRVLVASPAPPYNMFAEEHAQAEGFNLLSRWTHSFSEDSDYRFQLYFDRTDRRNLIIDSEINTVDLEYQQRFSVGTRNEVIYGGNYRYVFDEIEGSFNATYTPAHRQDQLFSVFLQDKLTLVEDRLWFTAGSKFEHNDYTGWELQPSGRLTYKPAEEHTFWGAVSRAVRTPSRFEHDTTANIAFPTTPNVITRISGDRRFISETLDAYELGYRSMPWKTVYFDVALFFHHIS